MDWKLVDDRPIWQQLSQQVSRRILTGAYPPGSKLPSVRELAAEAGVNPNTMQRALSQLEQDGLAVANRTAGRMVTWDEGIIEASRRAAAYVLGEEYFTAMAQLGYPRAGAIAFLEEERA